MEQGATATTILAVDDSPEQLFALQELLQREGYKVITALDGIEAASQLEKEQPDLILCDLVMPRCDGYELTRKVKDDPFLRYIPVVLLTSKSDLEDVTKGFEVGADDYIRKPFRPEELLARIQAAVRTRRLYRALEQSEAANRQLQARLGERTSFSSIIGRSVSMQAVFDLIDKVKEASVPVLITGESGTGKELVAQAVHAHSLRRNKPFVVQNCAALNENLLESELFGHVRGAFTGAVRDREGLFSAADGGSFFLDELGEMSPGLQVKLLRVLQDGTFTPVGDTRVKKVDVRIIAATNRDLKSAVATGRFREDLFYRLNVVAIELPPLRERVVDIPLLAAHFLVSATKRNNLPNKRLAPEVLQALMQYSWPGNVRELENVMERAVIMSGKAPEIELGHVSLQAEPEQERGSGRRVPGRLKDALENLERNLIADAMEHCGHNKSEAARLLGISRSNLIAKVQNYGLQSED